MCCPPDDRKWEARESAPAIVDATRLEVYRRGRTHNCALDERARSIMDDTLYTVAFRSHGFLVMYAHQNTSVSVVSKIEDIDRRQRYHRVPKGIIFYES